MRRAPGRVGTKPRTRELSQLLALLNCWYWHR